VTYRCISIAEYDTGYLTTEARGHVYSTGTLKWHS